MEQVLTMGRITHPMARRSLIAALFVMTGLAGCGEDQPQLNQQFTNYLEFQTNRACEGQCIFVSAAKADGRARDAKTYEMTVNLNIRAQKNLRYGIGAMSGWVTVGGPDSTADACEGRPSKGTCSWCRSD
jgi:hypothetical protein